MKVKTKQSEENKFTPFTLEIEVETLREARHLWHLFCIECVPSTINRMKFNEHTHPVKAIRTVIWDEIQKKIEPFEL